MKMKGERMKVNKYVTERHALSAELYCSWLEEQQVRPLNAKQWFGYEDRGGRKKKSHSPCSATFLALSTMPGCLLRVCGWRELHDEMDTLFVILYAHPLPDGCKNQYRNLTLDVSGTVIPVNHPVDQWPRIWPRALRPSKAAVRRATSGSCQRCRGEASKQIDWRTCGRANWKADRYHCVAVEFFFFYNDVYIPGYCVFFNTWQISYWWTHILLYERFIALGAPASGTVYYHVVFF